MVALGINWVTYRGQRLTYRTPHKGPHFELIERAMRAKLAQNPEVRRVLLGSGDLVLKPDHQQSDDAPPAWGYELIWMDLRSSILLESSE